MLRLGTTKAASLPQPGRGGGKGGSSGRRGPARPAASIPRSCGWADWLVLDRRSPWQPPPVSVATAGEGGPGRAPGQGLPVQWQSPPVLGAETRLLPPAPAPFLAATAPASRRPEPARAAPLSLCQAPGRRKNEALLSPVAGWGIRQGSCCQGRPPAQPRTLAPQTWLPSLGLVSVAPSRASGPPKHSQSPSGQLLRLCRS